jgi:hippurate hydrolase
MIGLRADMDALPMAEASGRDWTSKVADVFHGCGHDGHTVSLLATAEHLAATRAFRGTVVFIFQPAEEGLGGGRVMVEEGLFEAFPCDQIFGFHNMPLLPFGSAAVQSGPSMASFDEFKVTFNGKGGHAAMPHLSRDAVFAAAEACVSLQGLPAREVDPHVAAVLSVTQIHGGTTHNVIPEGAWIAGTVRTLDSGAQDVLQTALARVCEGVAHTRGLTVDVEYARKFPVLVNEAAATDKLRHAVEHALGTDALDDDFKPLLAAEDFAFMLQARPGAYVLLGQRDDDHQAMVHNPAYDFNDRLIPLAASVMTALVKPFS